MSHGRLLLVLLSLVILVTAMKIDIKEEKPYNLPGDIIPERYRLAVVTHINDDEGFRFTGKVWISLSCDELYWHPAVQIDALTGCV
uniref:Secreted protein n=1 Tax=Lutzomyia longipalpis TaxID=7200 RepID=A0A1B0GH90_LUTLO